MAFDLGKKLKSIPSWMLRGEYYNENGYLGKGKLRVVRVYNGKRTHNIDLVGQDVCWENSNSTDCYVRFESSEAALAWWNTNFQGKPRIQQHLHCK